MLQIWTILARLDVPFYGILIQRKDVMPRVLVLQEFDEKVSVLRAAGVRWQSRGASCCRVVMTQTLCSVLQPCDENDGWRTLQVHNDLSVMLRDAGALDG